MKEKTKRQPVVTPVGVAVWPHLNRPDTKFAKEDGIGVYRTKLRLSAEAAAPLVELVDQEFKNAYELDSVREAKKKNKKIKEADLPYANAVDDNGEETGDIEFTFKIKAGGKRKDGSEFTRKLLLWDAKRHPTTEDVWGGSKIKVAFTPNPFYVPALGVGVSLQLQSVQVIELVQGQARDAAGYGFDEEEGYEASPSDDTSDEETGAAADDTQKGTKAAVNF